MIYIKKDDYIVGIWYAERKLFGKAFIYAIKGKKENEWIGHILYRYHNIHINIFIDDDSPFNTFICQDVPESVMIKVCQDRISELEIIFCHESDYLMINGNLNLYKSLGQNKKWLPVLLEERKNKPKHNKLAK